MIKKTDRNMAVVSAAYSRKRVIFLRGCGQADRFLGKIALKIRCLLLTASHCA
jgi:hypothetical protein